MTLPPVQIRPKEAYGQSPASRDRAALRPPVYASPRVPGGLVTELEVVPEEDSFKADKSIALGMINTSCFKPIECLLTSQTKTLEIVFK